MRSSLQYGRPPISFECSWGLLKLGPPETLPSGSHHRWLRPAARAHKKIEMRFAQQKRILGLGRLRLDALLPHETAET